MTNRRQVPTYIPSVQTCLRFQNPPETRNAHISRGFSPSTSQLCISRQTVSTWLEKMILMNILGGCYLGTGLLGFACMRELVYWVLSVCRNMSTAVCLYGGTCPLLFYPSVRTCLQVVACMRELVCKYPLPCLAKCTCRQKEDFATEERVSFTTA